MKLLWKKKKHSDSVVDRGCYTTTTTTSSSLSSSKQMMVTNSKQDDTVSSSYADHDHHTTSKSSSSRNTSIDIVATAAATAIVIDDTIKKDDMNDEEDYVVVDSIVIPPMSISTDTTTTTSSIITTPKKNNNNNNPSIIPSSPTSLGSGHYSPKDGKVQTFYRKSIIPISTPTKTTITSTTTTSTSSTTTTPIIQEESMKYPIVDVTTNDVNDSISTSSNNEQVHLQQVEQQHQPTAVQTSIKNVTSTLTDDTSDTTTEDDDDEEVVMPVKIMVNDTNSNNNNKGDDIIENKTTTDTSTTNINNDHDPTTKNSTATCTEETSTTTMTEPTKPILFLRHSSSFLRVSDLLGINTNINLSEHSTQSIPNYHCCSDTPPPGIHYDSMEQWVALDNGTYGSNSNTHKKDDDDNNTASTTTTSLQTATTTTTTIGTSPIGQIAIDALATTGFVRMFDESMWIPDAKTNKILLSKSISNWENCTFPKQGVDGDTQITTTYPIITDNNTKLDDHILVWTGSFKHGLYGSDIPAIRSAAIIPMHPEQLLHLLIDSNRVKEYNSMSLGRTDLVTFDLPCPNTTSTSTSTTDNNISNHPNQLLNNTRHIVTKVMRSESRPPLLRKTLQFTSILHARCLSNNNDNHDDDGYIIVTRAVQSPSTGTSNTNTTKNDDSSVIVSEILLGVNVILKIHSNNNDNNNNNKCILLSVHHMRSPMVPLYIAKRLGVQAATNFIHDLRKCC